MNRNVRYFVLIALLSVAIASSVQALPNRGFYIVYYDSSFSEIVGEREYWCAGAPISWGVRTAYYQAEDWDCEDPFDYECWICSDGNCVSCA